MAFLRLINPNSQGRRGEVITQAQLRAIQRAQATYASQSPEMQAKLDNIAAIYPGKAHVSMGDGIALPGTPKKLTDIEVEEMRYK